MERKKIGIITKPQALKGEFRVKPDLLNLKYYKTFRIVYFGDKVYSVERVSVRDAFVIFKVQGIDSCEEVEAYRNTPIYADIESVERDENDYMDYSIEVNGEVKGKIVDINNYGSKDVWSIKGDREIMLPYIDGLIINSDTDNRVLTLNEELFKQVAVYED